MFAFALPKKPNYDLDGEPNLDFATLDYSMTVRYVAGDSRIDVFRMPNLPLEQCNKRLRKAAVSAHFIPVLGNGGAEKAFNDSRGRTLMLFEKGFSPGSKQPEIVYFRDATGYDEWSRSLKDPVDGSISAKEFRNAVMKARHP